MASPTSFQQPRKLMRVGNSVVRHARTAANHVKIAKEAVYRVFRLIGNGYRLFFENFLVRNLELHAYFILFECEKSRFLP